MKVVVTDHGEGDNTDFILSTRAYNKLALPGLAEALFSYGVVDVEYKRIPCQYSGYNLMFKVHEHSRFPDYLSLIPIYQAGVSEITAVEIWQVKTLFNLWRCTLEILPNYSIAIIELSFLWVSGGLSGMGVYEKGIWSSVGHA